MANVFFKAADAEDRLLLHADLRTHDDLEVVAYEAEAQVIDHFTEYDTPYLASSWPTFNPWSQTPRVRLLGYDESNPAASDAGLRQALRWAIAEVVSYRLKRRLESAVAEGYASETLGDYSYRRFSRPTGTDQSGFPDGWKRHLARYDRRRRHTYI